MDTGVLYLQSELLERRDVKKTLDTECPEYLEHYAITVITVSYLEPGQERKQHNTHVLEDDLGNVRRSLISIAKKKKRLHSGLTIQVSAESVNFLYTVFSLF